MKTRASDPFQAIADPSRRHILSLLSGNRLTINAVSEHFEMSRPAVSKHIRILHSAGFISVEETGRERYCTLDRAGFLALQEWIRYFDRFWRGKLDALDKFLSASSSGIPKTFPGKPKTHPGKSKASPVKPKALPEKSKTPRGKPKPLRPEKRKTTLSIQKNRSSHSQHKK